MNQFLTREIRIVGEVRNDPGGPLAEVSVRVVGADGGTTQADGTFAFTIPDARSADSYRVAASLDG